ncbi:MAG: aldolase/citrate lyase family protein [Armatimonadota bacterium]|nr:aldolase/citrate lyase family protein [Armatimonadota bacterium]MDR7440167.1 aldolase/citrate lyase family protein [Armatimonadota bacterium]MDR7563833.1 aldolase/citrate lyase family protein [Armatimonadota bacterium]MDR7567219.1 aldolase/citrate lyase family protein [Armatimonadota bacterium]MDR7603047.1 aldolase/citrate lyase family protein [Armatimonadota bacterium]
MIENRVKRRLQRDLPVVGHWLSFPCPAVAELLSAFEPDWLVVDTEHGPSSWETVENQLRAMRGTGVTPIVRVAANDAALIKLALDRGAMGVIVPLVSSPEEARRAVLACRYPPEGIRGVAGTRASRYGLDLPEYFDAWNREVLVICQVETLQGLQQVEEIAAVEGVDVLFVGPNDLSASVGHFRRFEAPEYEEAVQRVLSAARGSGKAAGYLASDPEEALRRIAQGFRFVGIGSDSRLLAAAVSSVLQRVRTHLQEEAS